MTEQTGPKIGAPAPGFSAPADGNRMITLESLRGKTVVLYFYPKDDTSGCTREAMDFTECAPDFQAAGAMVVGVSKDTVQRHEKFIGKHGLGIALVSDAESDICERYGTWVEKSMYGRKFMGIERATFLIDGEGTLRGIWRKVKVPGHVAEVLEAVRGL